MLSNWARPYYQESAHKPFLFYAVLGNFVVDEQLTAATAVLPQGLDLRVIEAAYFREGMPWELCRRHTPQTAALAESCPQALVLKGEVADSRSLDYLKGTLDFLTSLTDLGGEVVYDPFTLNWHSKEEWNAREEEGQIFNPFDHTVILSSEEPEGVWLHTRGLLKFGRPDLSARGLSPDEVPMVSKVIDRFISFQALGGQIEAGREIVLDGAPTGLRPGELRGSAEDPDFNNFHVELVASAQAD